MYNYTYVKNSSLKLKDNYFYYFLDGVEWEKKLGGNSKSTFMVSKVAQEIQFDPFNKRRNYVGVFTP